MPVKFVLAVVGSCLYTTRRGKFVVWGELLDKFNVRGDERILDLGCSRGAVLIVAARHLTTGRAVGVDVCGQSGNCGEATRRNAIAEGVADRVELQTGDMTTPPFRAPLKFASPLVSRHMRIRDPAGTFFIKPAAGRNASR